MFEISESGPNLCPCPVVSGAFLHVDLSLSLPVSLLSHPRGRLGSFSISGPEELSVLMAFASLPLFVCLFLEAVSPL